MRPDRRCEEGSTLLELLIAVVILGLAVTAVLGALATGVDMSAVDRAHARAEVVLRSYAESVLAAPTAGCPATYAFVDEPGDGVTVVPMVATDVTYLVKGSNPASYVAACQSPALAQRLTLRVTSDEARVGTLAIDIVKRVTS